MSASLVLSRTRLLAVVLAALLLAAFAYEVAAPRSGATNVSAAPGIRMTMTVKGTKQGDFKGEDSALTKTAPGLINVTAYSFELASPRDASTGLPTGRRIYKPLTITHVMGGSSPQFLAAAATNETLNPVVINFFRTDRTGKEVNYYRVTLTNATVSDVRQHSDGGEVLEDVSFTFQKVEQDDLIAKTSFLDDWQQAA